MADKLISHKDEKVKFLFRPSEARKTELKRTYARLMDRARGREKIKGSHERHHIKPVALGGDNSKDNLVYLTYKEHFIAHWLLVLINENKDRRKMLYAFRSMTFSNSLNSRIVSSWQFVLSRKALHEAMKGNKHCLGKPGNRGYRMTPEQLEAHRERNTGINSPVRRSVRCLDDGKIFFSIKEASKFYKIDSGNIPTVCRGKRKKAGGYRFEYVEKEYK